MNENADKNIKDFFDKYGKQGYAKLFLINYMFELIMYHLRSEDSQSKSHNTALAFHLKDDKIASLEDTESYQKVIRKICTKKAEQIVKKLDDEGFLTNLEKIKLDDPKLNQLMKEAIEDVFKPKKE